MDVSTLEWTVTLLVTVAVLVFDVFVVARRPRQPSMRECALTLIAYVGLALAFGLWVWQSHGSDYGLQFLAGWLTEYSLSVDNLFIFLVIMTSLRVPPDKQQTALLIGIVLALVLRGVFIALGAVATQEFSWLFYLFGLFLIWTAIGLIRDTEHDDDAENAVVRFARRRMRLSPFMIVIVALGTTDVLFALDSIPAVYGLTSEAYLVLTANIFALMGLRQLYFLLGGLMVRLIFLSQGLAVLLAFIGAKLILQSLHENEVPFINGGRPVDVPTISIGLSLLVIVGTLTLAAVASLWWTARHPEAIEPDSSID
jgi:tellurite resistance protein TerC